MAMNYHIRPAAINPHLCFADPSTRNLA
jgi:hypothetical protein